MRSYRFSRFRRRQFRRRFYRKRRTSFRRRGYSRRRFTRRSYCRFRKTGNTTPLTIQLNSSTTYMVQPLSRHLAMLEDYTIIKDLFKVFKFEKFVDEFVYNYQMPLQLMDATGAPLNVTAAAPVIYMGTVEWPAYQNAPTINECRQSATFKYWPMHVNKRYRVVTYPKDMYAVALYREGATTNAEIPRRAGWIPTYQSDMPVQSVKYVVFWAEMNNNVYAINTNHVIEQHIWTYIKASTY